MNKHPFIKKGRTYQDCRPEHCFWAHDGQILKNVGELPSALKRMKLGTYQHHVTVEKNDFATWVKDVFGDKLLAETMRKASSQHALVNILQINLRS